jgi:peptide deformylase
MAQRDEVESQGQLEATHDAQERAVQRAEALRLVRQYPDPVLRSPARPVADVDDDVRALIRHMTDVMTRAHGVGLAGPQVGVLRRLLVYRAGEDDVRALVNPRIAERSDESEADTEGCLSLLAGDLVVPVERNVRIRVEGLDGGGEEVDVEVDGFEARVIQHEVDHLDGVLIVDRTGAEERRGAMRELRLRATG